MANVFSPRRGRRLPARRWPRLALGLALLAGAAGLLNPPAARLDSGAVFAIRDAKIVTGTGRTIAKGTVVVRDGLIVEVGESVRIPGDAKVIDGNGLTVYPGLIDGYTSLGIPAAQPAPSPGGQGGRGAAAAAAASQPQSPHGDPSKNAADELKPGGSTIEDARNVGITTALSSPKQGIFPGQSAVINLAGDEAARMVVRAPVALTVQFTTSSGFFGAYPSSLMGTVAYIRQTFYDAIRYRDEIDRYERVKRGVPRPEYDRRLQALLPALKGDLPVLFVTNNEGDIRRALQISEEFKLKPILAGALYSYRMADALKAKKVPVILSLDFPRRPADLPDDEDEPLRVLRERVEIPKGAARLAQSGVKFAFTMGNARPADFIANLQKAVENGLSKDDAVRALTLSAAEILGVEDQLGSVEKGKIANLVVVSGDLLARDGKVRHIFIDGQEIELKKSDAPAGGRPGAARPGAASVDPTGDWVLNLQTPQGDMSVRLSIRREGNELAGTLTGHMGTVNLRNIGVTGNQIRFTASLEMGGQTLELVGTGTIEGDTMRGVVTAGALGSMDFTGSRPR